VDFGWNEEQLQRRAGMVEFASQRLAADSVARDRDGRFAREDWQACADFGVQALAVPSAYSGRGDTDFMTAMLCMEGLGYGCRDAGLTFALNAQMWTVQHPLCAVHAKRTSR